MFIKDKEVLNNLTDVTVMIKYELTRKCFFNHVPPSGDRGL